jgi:hypothetical protein
MPARVMLLVIALSPSLLAQNPGMMAAQQAQQAAQQASQEAMRANEEATRQAQQANEDAARASQQAAQNAQQAARICLPAARPQFSVKAGSFTKRVTVKIREKTRGAVVYYTTDGWTPTTNSLRYTGPLTFTSTTTLQAIAVAPDMPRSRIASGLYTVNLPAAQSSTGTGAAVTSSASAGTVPDGRMVSKGTLVPLVFVSDYSSRKADVGDKINLTLANDLKIGDVVIASKGATAIVNVTGAHKAGIAGLPGFIAFEAESLTIDGTVVKLQGTAAKEGREIQVSPATFGLALVPAGVLLVRGNEAEIKPGSVFTATVAQDTKLLK